MTLAQDLVSWVNERPDWQKAAIARFCRNEEYSSDELSALTDQLVAGTVSAAPDITVDDIPGASSSGARVVLSALRDVVGVNALLLNQNLTFADGGLTVIYGDNASGKSGYARLLREAVTARVKGDLLGDVFSEGEAEQAATVDYKVGDQSHAWALGDDQAQELTSVRFYDVDCGDDYISKAAEITYRPYTLTLLDRLQALCRELQAELDRRLASNQQAHPDLPELEEGTAAATFIDGLSKDTTTEAIAVAAKLTDDHTERLAAKLQENVRLSASNPNTEKARLSGIAANWVCVKNHIDELASIVTQTALDAVVSAKNAAADLLKAAQIASAEQFKAEPLEGVGSETWRALWSAAREFSAADAYHDHEFPNTDADAVCVLCQQPLSEEGADRLTRFQSFVADTTSRDADIADGKMTELRSVYVALQTVPSAVTESLARLQADGENVETSRLWVASATEVTAKVVKWIDGLLEAMPSPASAAQTEAIEMRRQAAAAAAEAIDAETFNATLTGLQSEIAELKARGGLSAASRSVEQAIASLKDRDKLDAAKRQTLTTGITQKATDLTTTYVTAIARDQFTREAERLDLQRITLNPVRGRHTSTLEHQPELLGATIRVSVTEVFSEGEQTALGLAGFLTEVHLDESKSAVIFDDPVSSLDAGRRSKVAKRLVELATERQVVVFTHEITFVNELMRKAKNQSQGLTPRSIQRSGDKPGKVSDKFPWQAQDVPQRVNELQVDLARIKREKPNMDDEEYTKQVCLWAGRLSETWERAVNLEIVNQLVDRGMNKVQPLMLKILPKFDQTDHDEFQNGYSQVSSWAARHDNAPEENYQAPTVDELEAELERLKTWHGRVKGYRN
ncbi:MAG: AAA family ATPase [Candidatus Nanopelagicales bacterium]|nr:AAA family ATPase [Candidatus Nanopelagicales bacterium]